MTTARNDSLFTNFKNVKPLKINGATYRLKQHVSFAKKGKQRIQIYTLVTNKNNKQLWKLHHYYDDVSFEEAKKLFVNELDWVPKFYKALREHKERTTAFVDQYEELISLAKGSVLFRVRDDKIIERVYPENRYAAYNLRKKYPINHAFLKAQFEKLFDQYSHLSPQKEHSSDAQEACQTLYKYVESSRPTIEKFKTTHIDYKQYEFES